MAKQSSTILSMLAWFTGVVVSLAVGMGLINGTLILPDWIGGATEIGQLVTQAAGWIVVVTTMVGAVMAILKK